MSLFLEEASADHYDEARPYFHPVVLRRVMEWIPGDQLQRSLDVGCGTGQSTEALALVSETRIGLDVSAAMLRHARRAKVTGYVQGRAEQIPFAAASFDFLTVGLAIHWFEREAFLHEAARVLRPGGWLCIYNSWFTGVMRENPAFKEWWSKYLQRFPSPPRNNSPLTSEVTQHAGFRESYAERFSHSAVYDLDGLIAYLTTQTNVTSALHDRRETSETVNAWLRAGLEPLLAGSRATFEYGGSMTLFERFATTSGARREVCAPFH
jgi:ubiquinone/menaquinone biosynthesis C-methylase UbiE